MNPKEQYIKYLENLSKLKSKDDLKHLIEYSYSNNSPAFQDFKDESFWEGASGDVLYSSVLLSLDKNLISKEIEAIKSKDVVVNISGGNASFEYELNGNLTRVVMVLEGDRWKIFNTKELNSVCYSFSDCSHYYRCINHRCVSVSSLKKLPSCKRDEDCKPSEICYSIGVDENFKSQDHCVRIKCENWADCPAGYDCKNFVCKKRSF